MVDSSLAVADILNGERISELRTFFRTSPSSTSSDNHDNTLTLLHIPSSRAMMPSYIRAQPRSFASLPTHPAFEKEERRNFVLHAINNHPPQPPPVNNHTANLLDDTTSTSSSTTSHNRNKNSNENNDHDNRNNNEDEGAPEDPIVARKKRPDLQAFLHDILTEAQSFLLTTIPRSFKIEGKPRSSPPSTAKVQLLNRVIRVGEPPSSGDNNNSSSEEQQNLRDEFWVCRRSVHADAPVDGTASWEEFRSGLLDNHSENEMAYTPSLTGVCTLMEWPTQDEIEGGWKNVEMHGTFTDSYIYIRNG